jgi:hypothetical protein
MRADTRPCVAVNVEKQCILRCPYEAIGDHVRMLCKEQHWYNRTGGEPFDVVAAHPVQEGDAVVSDHADDASVGENAYGYGRGERLIVLDDARGGAGSARERLALGRIGETHYGTRVGDGEI